MNKLKIDYLPLSALHPYENNPRFNEQAVPAVAASIHRFGFNSPIVIDRENTIVCGHTRYLAAQSLGLKEAPCVRLDDLTDKQVKQFRLADNKVAERASWDEELLADELGCIRMDMTVFGFEPKLVREDNFNEPKPRHPITQRGDLWLLGRHRLYCGDATNERDVAALMDGRLADMLLTDPPYNVAYEGKTSDRLTIANDAMPDERFRAFLTDSFRAADAVMKPGAVFEIWHADSEGYNFRVACEAAGWTVRCCLIWDKNAMVLGRQDYHWKHEPCLMGWKDGAEPLWVSDGTPLTTILRYKKPVRNGEHPTMKPVLLFDRLIQTNTREDDIVLDTFAGSGTTIIAAEQNGRTGYVMELDPAYADVIVKRYVRLTGSDEDVFLIRGGKRRRKSDVKEEGADAEQDG